jgi:hypothetical protein
MLKHISHDLRIALVGGVAGAIIAGPTGAIAAYVANADRVDHKHAVGAAASKAHRAGKLVATDRHGRLPNNIIMKAPNADRLGGLSLVRARTQWISVLSNGDIRASSPDAADVAASITHPAVGTYCMSEDHVDSSSVAGNVQSQLNGFTDLTMVVTSLYNTSACPGLTRIYTATGGTLDDSPFTLTFSRSD